MKKIYILILLVLIILAGILLFYETNDTETYVNEKFGFQIELPRGVYVVEEEDGPADSSGRSDSCIYFNSKEIAATHSGFDGTIFRIEITNKHSCDNLAEVVQGCEDAYGFRILDEDNDYIIGWANSTDVQYPDGYAQLYSKLYDQSKDVIKTFKRD